MAHKAKSLVLSCIDFRFQKMIEDYIEIDAEALKSYDHIAVAGAVKQLVKPDKPEFKEYVLKQIDISVSLHNPDIIYLINHEDCGAYGTDNSVHTHTTDLHDAKKLLQKIYPKIEIQTFLATFNGLETV